MVESASARVRVGVMAAALALIAGCPTQTAINHADAGRDASSVPNDSGATDGGTTDTGAATDTGGTSDTGGATDAGDDAAAPDTGEPWPTCETAPPSATTGTIHDVWVADPATPTRYFLPNVVVTGVSRGGCVAGSACTIFVQSAETFASLAAGSQQSIMLFVSANTASHFTSVAVGQRADVSGYAWRYDLDGRRDLLLQVNLMLPGCARMTGAASPTPVSVALTDLTLSAYEDTVGPLLVRVSTVSGRPQMPTETFGLWSTGTFSDAGITGVVSLSPYLMTGGAFTGLTTGAITDFTSVTGVFGLFVPPGGGAKYLEIYTRAAAEYPIAMVH